MDERFGIVRFDRWEHKLYVFCPYCGAKDVLKNKDEAGSLVPCNWCNKIYIMPIM